ALVVMLERKGAHRRAIELLEPLRRSTSPKTRRAALQTLANAYTGVNQTLKALEARRGLDTLREEHPEVF
ncbi:MAG: hypothetical protein ACXVPX_09210, partial [Actinomycetota bacterium]